MQKKTPGNCALLRIGMPVAESPGAMPGAAPKKCHQRRPENTVLYRIIQQHLESFLGHTQDSSGKRSLKYVENEFRRYLECGVHAPGFARAVCDTCGDDLLLPFSCKLRVAIRRPRSFRLDEP